MPYNFVPDSFHTGVMPEALQVLKFVIVTFRFSLWQGRINQYANYAMAWGPPVQGTPLGGTNFLIFKFQSTLIGRCIILVLES